jgi:hypothetical protein
MTYFCAKVKAIRRTIWRGFIQALGLGSVAGFCQRPNCRLGGALHLYFLFWLQDHVNLAIIHWAI